jgi:hypothetical protein
MIDMEIWKYENPEASKNHFVRISPKVKKQSCTNRKSKITTKVPPHRENQPKTIIGSLKVDG